MFSLTFELTNLCNRSCIHCLMDKLEQRGSIPLDLAEKIMIEARNLGINKIHITGGEPALYPDLEKFLALASDDGFQFDMVTNGHRFRKRMLPLLTQPKINKNLEKVCFSLDGASVQSHDALRGEGSFKEVIEAATLCRIKDIRFGLKTAITNLNKDELTEIALLGATLGASYIDFIALYPTPRLIREAMIPSPKELERICSWIIESIANSVKINVWTNLLRSPSVVFCCDAFNNITVDFQGNLTFCAAISHFADDGKPARLGRECIADLKKISFKEGIVGHFNLLSELMRERLDDSDRLNHTTYNPCYWCLKRFGKLDWLQTHTESPWASEIINKGEPEDIDLQLHAVPFA
jgi:MoaA/NifB/PqqE/SkfB family radical SAM enzyme